MTIFWGIGLLNVSALKVYDSSLLVYFVLTVSTGGVVWSERGGNRDLKKHQACF